MNILIIGASGYIGSRVAASLAGAGHQVTALRHPDGSATPHSARLFFDYGSNHLFTAQLVRRTTATTSTTGAATQERVYAA
jgi:uncharacterized protein YbjT (DUF2867 family)